MDISNNHRAALTLPNGQTVPPQGSVSVSAADWSAMKDHPVVNGWLDEKKLAKGADPDPEPIKPTVVAPDSMTDGELAVFLKDNGVSADGRWGRERMLAEAKKVAVKA